MVVCIVLYSTVFPCWVFPLFYCIAGVFMVQQVLPGCHAVQRGREGVMANIRGKKPLTHGTGIVGLWKIHLNIHTQQALRHAHKSHKYTNAHMRRRYMWIRGDSLFLFTCTYIDSFSNTGLLNTWVKCIRMSLLEKICIENNSKHSTLRRMKNICDYVCMKIQIASIICLNVE